MLRNSFNSFDVVKGIEGDTSDIAIYNKAVAGLSKLIYSLQGTYPVNISRTMQPKDQISAAGVRDSYLTTSGAIHGILP